MFRRCGNFAKNCGFISEESQKKSLTNADLVKRVENVLPEPLSWICTNIPQSGKAIFKRKIVSFTRTTVLKMHKFRHSHMLSKHCLPCKLRDCEMCGKYFTIATDLKMRKFYHSHKMKIVSFAKKKYFNFHEESYVYSHRRKAL